MKNDTSSVFPLELFSGLLVHWKKTTVTDEARGMEYWCGLHQYGEAGVLHLYLRSNVCLLGILRRKTMLSQEIYHLLHKNTYELCKK